MAIGVMTIVYIVFVVLMAMTGVVFILMIAGKDIMFAFQRFFNKKGCFVFIINSARFASLSFLTPKENSFRINSNIYATNPKKCLTLDTKYITAKDREKILKSLTAKETQLNNRIARIEASKAKVIGGFNLKALSEEQRLEIIKRIVPMDAEINRLQTKLNDIDKSENYYYKSKPAFFFIEGDPVPKDFFELYSEFDSKIIDNLAARAASSAASLTGKKGIDIIKWACVAAAIGGCLAAFIAFRNQTMIQALLENAGVAISI